MSMDNLNTSYVKVQLLLIIKQFNIIKHLNTSYVKVQ